MPELPVISWRECVHALEQVGYSVARTRGSHLRVRCPGRDPVTIPRHQERDRTTLRSIIRQAGLTVEEFIALLEA
ncbi:MAG: type II toxin-antitoxin system HicA family toxin [Chloroflexi bacterium]|nr:type II toxin-antitoxin system HicA family toxin [Chloroflexota bacterium]